MNRLSQGLLITGATASIAGLVWRLTRRNQLINRRALSRFANGTLNTTIKLMSSLGLFRIIGRSRFLNRMVR